MSESSNEIKRWTAKRRTALVLEILQGKTTAAEAARRHCLKVSEIEDWKNKFLAGAENALRSRPPATSRAQMTRRSSASLRSRWLRDTFRARLLRRAQAA